MSSDGKGLKDEGTQTQVAIAGAVAGLVSRFVTAPLDVLKIRLQLSTHPLNPLPAITSKTSSTDQAPESRQQKRPLSQRPYAFYLLRNIIRNEGPTALWKGNVPAQLLYLSYSAAQFSAYHFCAGKLSWLIDRNTSTRDPSSSSASSSFSSSAPTPSPFEQALVPLIAGATAGAVATAATYPLDLLRTRFTAQGATAITNNTGDLAFPHGSTDPPIQRKEKVYPTLRAAVRSLVRGEEAILAPAKSASTATSTNDAPNRGASTLSARIRTAYRGLAAAELGTAPYMGLFFCSYELLRTPLRTFFSIAPAPPSPSSSPPSSTGNNGSRKTAAADMTASTVAAVFSKTVVFPLDTVRKRMQVEGPLREYFVSDCATEIDADKGNGSGNAGKQTANCGSTPHKSNKGTADTGCKFKGTFQTAADIVRTEGWRGLYRGWAVGLGKTAPASMVTVCIYEWVLYRLMSMMD